MPIPTGLSEKPNTSDSTIERNPTTDSSNTGSAGGQTGPNAPQNKTEPEEAADRLYEERIEEEYAKREGGA